MLMNINQSLTGIPIEMVPALAGQGSPFAVSAAVLRVAPRENEPRRFGAAMSCFISAYKSFGRTS